MKIVGISLMILGIFLLGSGIVLDMMGWPGDDIFRLPGAMGIAAGLGLLFWHRMKQREKDHKH